MGATGSDMVEGDMDKEEFEEALGEGNYDDDDFQELADEDGKISKAKIMELIAKTDAFLTHDWSEDELGRNNHDRVARVNKSLKERGINTWFDSDRMQGNIMAQMCAGIDNTHCLVVFVTKRYVDKVGGDVASDNCKKEFNYAERRVTGAHMVTVCMEPGMRDPKTWSGPVGMVLGGDLYIDLSSDEHWDDNINKLAASINQKKKQG
jgi:hypothetical protein